MFRQAQHDNEEINMNLIARFLVGISLSCTVSLLAADQPPPPPRAALDQITGDGLLEHIKVLGSDEFEGRAPGSRGEELSIKYIASEFKKLGLKPGNPNGTYFQEVPNGWDQRCRHRRVYGEGQAYGVKGARRI